MSWFSDFLDRFRRKPTPIPTPGPAGAGMLAAVNRERQRAGLQPVAEHPVLMKVAADFAGEMARLDRLGHQRADGRWPWDVASALGYPGQVGEDAAEGQATAEAAVAGWMTSPGHRAVILDGRYRSLGWGQADGRSGRYWCLDLGTA